LPHLLPGFYASVSPAPSTGPLTAILSLLHLLVLTYPSQSRYEEHLDLVSNPFLPRGSQLRVWLVKLTRSLRTRNYSKLEQLTNEAVIHQILESNPSSLASWKGTSLSGASPDLPSTALCTMIDAIRAKARDTTWQVLRSAYRELHCTRSDPSSPRLESSPLPTVEWLSHSLALRPASSPPDHNAESFTFVEKWLSDRMNGGEVRPKEGTPDRWIICKLPVKT